MSNLESLNISNFSLEHINKYLLNIDISEIFSDKLRKLELEYNIKKEELNNNVELLIKKNKDIDKFFDLKTKELKNDLFLKIKYTDRFKNVKDIFKTYNIENDELKSSIKRNKEKLEKDLILYQNKIRNIDNEYKLKCEELNKIKIQDTIKLNQRIKYLFVNNLLDRTFFVIDAPDYHCLTLVKKNKTENVIGHYIRHRNNYHNYVRINNVICYEVFKHMRGFIVTLFNKFIDEIKKMLNERDLVVLDFKYAKNGLGIEYLSIYNEFITISFNSLFDEVENHFHNILNLEILVKYNISIIPINNNDYSGFIIKNI